jgi:hypothetical protein
MMALMSPTSIPHDVGDIGSKIPEIHNLCNGDRNRYDLRPVNALRNDLQICNWG